MWIIKPKYYKITKFFLKDASQHHNIFYKMQLKVEPYMKDTEGNEKYSTLRML